MTLSRPSVWQAQRNGNKGCSRQQCKLLVCMLLLLLLLRLRLLLLLLLTSAAHCSEG
jgi:hypothetical protein